MQELIEAKDVKYVLHFTRLSNLPSILEKGLINRVQLNLSGVQSEFNDNYRLDGQQDSISCSISFPNYKMFYKLRQENPDVEWVVLYLKSSVLWEKDCAFCVSNAASNEVTSIPIQARKGTVAFNRLFENVPGKPTRADIGIPDALPTNPQAEVLVFGNIEINYIIGAITQSKETEELLKAKYPNYKFVYHNEAFLPRMDYEYWR